MKVLFLTNIPSPYRVDFFNELGKLCDLTVIFERSASSERDDSWKSYKTDHFTPVVLRGIKRSADGAFCPEVLKYLKKGIYDHIIVMNFTSPTGMLAIAWMRAHKIPYWLESDGGFAKNGVGFKEKVKKHFIKGAIGYFSTAQEHDRYYLQYGAEPDRIYRYPFTSLKQRDILEVPISKNEKLSLRQKLGIAEEHVLLSVGQFIPRKGFDVLIDAMAQLPGEIGCYIVGGEPTSDYLEQVKTHNLSNVHFVGFCVKNVLAEYYKAADAFVLPTREDIWGLVVNEAMAYGLPVITTDRCIAGLDLVEDGENGYIVPVGDEDALATRLDSILRDPAAAERMAQGALKKIALYTTEEMAKRHITIFRRALR